MARNKKSRNQGEKGGGQGSSSKSVEMVDVSSEEESDQMTGRRCGRGNKRGRQSNSSDYSDSEEEMDRMVKKPEKLIAIIRFNEKGQNNIKKISPILLTTVLAQNIGDIVYAKVLNDGNIMIMCKDEAQLKKALEVKEIGRIGVVSTGRVGGRRNKGSKGVITNVPMCMKMEEIKGNLKGGKILNVQRMTAMKEGEKKETETVMIEFEGENLPLSVQIGYMSYSVRPYVQKPMRCFKCQRFGHLAKFCKEKRRCARCGGDHEYGNCGEGVRPKCCNCGGNHSVAYWGCEVMKREIAVQQKRVSGKMSYADAVRSIEEERKVEGCKNESTAGKRMDEEKKVWAEKKRLVTFIAGVINATAEIKSKTERTKIIVKAAVHHLGMTGLKWEEIQDELSIQPSQEPTSPD